MAVDRPRVGLLDAGHEVAVGGRGRQPEPEGAVDVDPGAGVVRRAGAAPPSDRRRRCSRCRPGRTRSCGRRAAGGQSGRIRPWPSTGTRDDPVAAEAEQRQRLQERDVDLLAHHHGERRRAEEAVGLDVPALAGQQRRGAPRPAPVRFAHRGAGREPDGRAGRQAEQVEQPAGGDLLQS